MFARRPGGTLLVLGAAALLAVSCTSFAVDVKEALDITETSSGWYDAGIVDRKNKVVPSVTFRIRRKPGVNLNSVALNVVFRQAAAAGASTPPEEWDEVFLQTVAISEGDQSPPLTVRPQRGYTGDPPQTRLEILNHSMFRDVRAHIFAKHSSTQWIEIGSIDVKRELLVR
jgi:hypothetical protein